jgi:DNA polymerase-1
MQNLAAEIVKIAMNDLHYKHHAPMLLQVHDELIFEIPKEDALEYGHWLLKYVPTITTVNGVVFPVEVGIGDNWHEAMSKEKQIKV